LFLVFPVPRAFRSLLIGGEPVRGFEAGHVTTGDSEEFRAE
jgi:hypothetical protein